MCGRGQETRWHTGNANQDGAARDREELDLQMALSWSLAVPRGGQGLNVSPLSFARVSCASA